MIDSLESLYELERNRIESIAGDAGDYRRPVFGDGNIDASVLFIGEAPGADEAAYGKPFVGKAGKQLDKLLFLAEIPRGSVYITNAVKFRPVKYRSSRISNRSPLLSEIKDALPVLIHEIKTVKPRVIATLGNTPLTAIKLMSSDVSGTIGDLHGRSRIVHIDDLSVTLMPLYHPASVIYNPSLAGELENDIKRLGVLYKSV